RGSITVSVTAKVGRRHPHLNPLPSKGEKTMNGQDQQLMNHSCISAAPALPQPLPLRLYRPCRSYHSLHSSIGAESFDLFSPVAQHAVPRDGGGVMTGRVDEFATTQILKRGLDGALRKT